VVVLDWLVVESGRLTAVDVALDATEVGTFATGRVVIIGCRMVDTGAEIFTELKNDLTKSIRISYTVSFREESGFRLNQYLSRVNKHGAVCQFSLVRSNTVIKLSIHD
jgi:hypothetical protein